MALFACPMFSFMLHQTFWFDEIGFTVFSTREQSDKKMAYVCDQPIFCHQTVIKSIQLISPSF